MIMIQSSEALLACVLLMVVLSLCIGLFVLAKGDLRRVEHQCKSRFASIEAKSADSEVRFHVLESQLGELGQHLKQIDHAVQCPAHTVLPLGNGPSQGKRTAIIRLAQRGERTGDIARTVGMPTSEVDLLLKVHRAVSTRVLPQLKSEESVNEKCRVVEEVFGARS